MNIRICSVVIGLLLSAFVSAQTDKGDSTRQWIGTAIDIPPPTAPAPEPYDSAKVYTMVEQMPEYPGGHGAMMSYLSQTIKYPAEALDDGIEGKVILRFVVDAEGQVGDVKVMRGVRDAPSLEREAVRVVKRMPKWKPGQQGGKAVATYFTLPVMFKMTEPMEEKQPDGQDK